MKVGMQGGEVTSESQRDAILVEMERILADPAFSGSKRCQALFRRLVEHALEGEQEKIKERTLGIEVFGRDASYDTAADPVVRITANEIRKRLGQWYQERDHHHSVRIRLIAGTYIPKFEFDEMERQEASEVNPPEPATDPLPAAPDLHVLAEAAQPETPTRRTSPVWFGKKWILTGAVVVLAVAAISVVVSHTDLLRSRQERIWHPLLESNQPLTLCISDAESLVNADVKGSAQWPIIAAVIASRQAPDAVNPTNPTPTTSMVDAEVAHKIASWLGMQGKQSGLRPSSAVNLQDLRRGPVVLIGAFNPWSLILLSNLRYSVRVDPATHDKWIQDAENASKRDWKIDGNLEHASVDYAVITRYLDAETGEWIFALGGLWPYGTSAAGDLITDPSFAQLLPTELRSKQNFQIVLKTNVINGNAGPPQVLAVHTW